MIGTISFGHQREDIKNYDVTRRIFYSMRRIGNGYAGMKTILVIANDGEEL